MTGQTVPGRRGRRPGTALLEPPRAARTVRRCVLGPKRGYSPRRSMPMATSDDRATSTSGRSFPTRPRCCPHPGRRAVDLRDDGRAPAGLRRSSRRAPGGFRLHADRRLGRGCVRARRPAACASPPACGGVLGSAVPFLSRGRAGVLGSWRPVLTIESLGGCDAAHPLTGRRVLPRPSSPSRYVALVLFVRGETRGSARPTGSTAPWPDWAPARCAPRSRSRRIQHSTGEVHLGGRRQPRLPRRRRAAAAAGRRRHRRSCPAGARSRGCCSPPGSPSTCSATPPTCCTPSDRQLACRNGRKRRSPGRPRSC